MTGWIILGAVLLLVLFILLLIATVVVDYNGELLVKISVLGIKIFTYPSSRKRRSKAKSKSKKQSKKDDDEELEKNVKKEKSDKKKLSLGEILGLVKLVLESIGKPLKKMLKRVSVSHLSIKAVCGGENAAKAALNYGTANYLLGVALNLMDEWLTLKEPDQLKIDVDFQSEETAVDFYAEIRLTVGSMLAFGLTFLFRAIKRYISDSKAKNAVGKIIGK